MTSSHYYTILAFVLLILLLSLFFSITIDVRLMDQSAKAALAQRRASLVGSIRAIGDARDSNRSISQNFSQYFSSDDADADADADDGSVDSGWA